MDREGDVLILDPHQIPDHLPSIDFSKYLGRPEPELNDDLLEDELVLNPDPNVNKPRTDKGLVPMEKQTGRPVEQTIDDDEEFFIP
mmetsp:Transcript_1435/g.1938  ORF Transcript_1435/g.1938 Transcript_1435/m.1938 type:complete len:86 (+) Transcript_1435:1097-1354(+)|eukprot:CAMPEP_0170509270 /NCGR_PEP_ID=MMETSP0208-20121228/64957_1 /TAXON_ID=197538 /ORGANISM="Strombidium inclinatum, Strain S3" /LENGTH=85 /DNA_ID=CAMNT_0010792597 /DNA_START=1077 /DNA_END=1334 /DNA_ORIENTATION=+